MLCSSILAYGFAPEGLNQLTGGIEPIDSDPCNPFALRHPPGIAHSRSRSTAPMMGTNRDVVSQHDHTTRARNVETGADVPNSFLSGYIQFLPDFVVPDLTREIHNKTLVVHGGYSLVFCADRKESQVALKVRWSRALGNKLVDKDLKRLKRKVRVWASLEHPNIVPLLGLCSGELGPGLVTPWYSNGNILQYLRRVPNVRREPLCEDVASGLRYLHEQDPPIIHGDLRGANVLVAMDGHAVLCDFGLATILDSDPTGFTSFTLGCTLRFTAPEEFANDLEGRSIPTDVYSYACTYAQIMTGEPPFHWCRTDPLIMRAICGGELPYRIDSIVSHHDLGFLEPSWDADPACRSTMSNICRILGIPEDAP
ncbi:hypothetical protein BS47DRAFT_1486460 [Hydnum rufescens UP504]|uniref:Protein kinase domain-containing protein n=1 Tax=Hydnum rufescens UP504 TaxID=1448309 RepID=A0A9P6AVM3_9AGAM|nr:hypothetical protein BS47DRAFT_1486460 [Hydnum rufescens UP504]